MSRGLSRFHAQLRTAGPVRDTAKTVPTERSTLRWPCVLVGCATGP